MTSTLTPVRKRSALTKGQLPKFAPYVVLALALVVGAAIMAVIGFNAFGWGIVAAILFTAGLVGRTDAARLDLALGRPIRVVDSTDVDPAGKPLVTKRSRFAAERVEFLIENG